jgi:DNA repair protein RecO
MVYETYETESFVLSAKNLGEGDRIFELFTKDFGLIRAQAKNVRAESSKLRYHLQPLSHVHVAVIRGKEYWRIVGVKDADHLFVSFKDDTEALMLVRRVFNLLHRLIPGEDKNFRLFSTIESLIASLRTEALQSLKHLEILIVARILDSLGYFPKKSDYHKLLEEESDINVLVHELLPFEKALVGDINTALRESQL